MKPDSNTPNDSNKDNLRQIMRSLTFIKGYDSIASVSPLVLPTQVRMYKRAVNGKCLIGVESLFRVLWDLCILCALVLQAFWIPFSLGLSVPLTGVLIYIDIVITFAFIVDIILNFNTTVNDRGTIIRDRKQIAKMYLKLWFWIDIVASFPYDWVLSGSFGQEEDEDSSTLSKAPQLLRIVKVLRFIRMLRLVRLAKLKQILFRIEDYMSNEFMYVVFTMSKMGIVIFFIAHLSACCFFYVSESSSIDNPDSWISSYSINADGSLGTAEKYVSVLYWATTTMITLGFGDISAYNSSEKIFAIIAMTVSCGYYAFILGKITGFFAEKLERDTERYEKHMALNRFLRKKKLPSWLFFKVKRYLNYISEANQVELEHEDFMGTLSIPLKNEIYSYLYKDTLDSCKVIKQYFPLFLSSTLIKHLVQETFSPGDVIISEGSFTRKIYFIKQGTVYIFHSATLMLFKELNEGECFGEVGFFFGRMRTASAVCKNFTEFMTLDWDLTENEIKNYTSLLEFLRLSAKDSLSGNYSSFNLSCYICESKTHIAPCCHMVTIPKQHQNTKKEWLNSHTKSKRIPMGAARDCDRSVQQTFHSGTRVENPG